MPSFAPPPPNEYRPSVIESLEQNYSSSSFRAYDNEAGILRRNRDTSQFTYRRYLLDLWIEALPQFTNLPQCWDSYGASSPSNNAVDEAARMLVSLKSRAILPESVRTSAEGGIAITFTGSGNNRALMEALNDKEQYLLLYDLTGANETVDWPTEDTTAQNEVLSILINHLRGHAHADEIVGG